MGYKTFEVSVESIDVLNNKMKCIKLYRASNDGDIVSTFYKPGIGIVKIVLDNEKHNFKQRIALKSYKLN